MTVAVCISDGGGISFFGKRQSSDSKQIEDLLSLVGEGRLYISEYSLPLFKNFNAAPTVAEDPLTAAGKGEFVFSERDSLAEAKKKISTLIIYRWNRAYPSNVALAIDPKDMGMALKETKEFRGSSHECITREIYEKV